ncbi:MAG: peroxide stress protein YaaA [Pseudomonadota bacterium]
MLTVISPAKKLDWAERETEQTQPEFGDDAIRLAKTARNLTLRDLRGLMNISDDLARLNRDRFRAFENDPDLTVTRPAVFAFAGDTYLGLDAGTLDAADLGWAQDHLRILSGLYGLLRPLDAIQPYRLEMGSRLKTRRGKSLYQYWRDHLSRALNAQAEAVGTQTLINCASPEYFGAVAPKALKLRVITPSFQELKDGTPRTVGFFAKRARGAMARFAIRNKLNDPEGLKEFDIGGYVYSPEQSSPDAPVFLRPYPDASSSIEGS